MGSFLMLQDSHPSEWEEADCFSFEDSERFEDESLCSWVSEPEGSCNNWRGWKKPVSINNFQVLKTYFNESNVVLPLVELAAKQVAKHIPFELVERFFLPVPEQLQLRITFWSFPGNEEDIRLYSCLANGSADEYSKGEHLFKSGTVLDSLQIGFHLSATVTSQQSSSDKTDRYNVAVTFDRGHIASCHCTCSSPACWCAHVVAVCLHRIHMVCLRAPVSESLSRLHRDQLQKFSQYLISELPQQILPTAQRLLDELLSSKPSSINTVCGAPDPTAGASVQEQTAWYLDESTLHENVRKILNKFCVPTPVVFSDVNCLNSAAPAVSVEWSSLLRPLRGREPEGMWNLLSIVREMFRRKDRNAVLLLQILTEECLACDQVLVWWFNTKVSIHVNTGSHGSKSGFNNSSHTSQHACASLCDEIVQLWRLASLNPALSPGETKVLELQLRTWHMTILEKISKNKNGILGGERRVDVDQFPGFKAAIEACLLNWEDYAIPGVTYSCDSPIFEHSLSCMRPSYTHLQCSSSSHEWNQYNAPTCHNFQLKSNVRLEHRRSSLSSEGFCENEGEKSVAGCLLDVTVDSAVDMEGCLKSDVDLDSDWSSAPEANSGLPATGLLNKESPQNSSDELQIYYLDTLSPSNVSETFVSTSIQAKKKDGTFLGIRKLENPMEILFARAEALYAHGHTAEACKLSVQLAEELLANPPHLLAEPSSQSSGKKRKKVNSASHQISQLASATLSKIAFLCSVLAENSQHSHLAFKVGLSGLELARSPASSKFLEVRLANQESDLVGLLKRIPIHHEELVIIREKAQQLRDNTFHSRGEALLPIMLATYIFDVLVLNANLHPVSYSPLDAELGFQAAVAALGLKANVSEAEHPLLCEGTRRQRGELIVTLVVHYKDDKNKLAAIMDKVLDKDMHQLYKDSNAQSLALNANFYNSKPATGVSASGLENFPAISTSNLIFISGKVVRRSFADAAAAAADFEDCKSSLARLSLEANTPAKSRHKERRDSFSCDDSKDWEAKFRCANLKTPKRHSNGMASIDSSAPETTSSDNSPTLVRRIPWSKLSGPGSDSGSSGNSSNSLGSYNSSEKTKKDKLNCDSSTFLAMPSYSMETSHGTTRLGISTSKTSRFKGKRTYPTVPNQPSEATAYFMFELANTLLRKAGGSSVTSMFTQPINNQNHRGPHRGLHMCAFQIGLYALGLHNCVSPNWLSRTYSSHVSWIAGQAVEIGVPALSFLIYTWPGHLTPTEVANLADTASRTRDQRVVHIASELALSCLSQAHALNPAEIQRAIQQCKDQGESHLESACIEVENAAKGDGISPEVLFHVAKCWFEIYENRKQAENKEKGIPTQESIPSDNPPYELTGVQQFYPPALDSSYPADFFTLPTTPCPPFQLAFSYSPFNVSYPVILPSVPLQNQSQYMPFFSPGVIQGIPQQLHLLGRPTLATSAVSASNNSVFAGFSPINSLLISPRPSTIVVASQPSAVLSSVPVSCSASSTPKNQHPDHLQCAYRVGMLAMEALSRKVHDDRSQQRYARTPGYRDDVKWLLRVSKILGLPYVNQFCVCSVNSIVSPFVLQEIVLEVADYPVKVNGVVQNFRNVAFPQLVQRCQQMFMQCIHQKLYHITAADYDEFVTILVAARTAFQMAAVYSMGPVNQFLELLHYLKRQGFYAEVDL